MNMNDQKPRPPLSPARLIYTGLGLGLIPKAPGTFGTLLGLPLWWFCRDLTAYNYSIALLFVFTLGTWAAQKAERDLGRHDAGEVVIDEVLGYLVTMFLVPAFPYNYLWGFVFFRLFDIVKPWPVSWADNKVPGALGVMLDDVLAGLYAALAIRIIWSFLA